MTDSVKYWNYFQNRWHLPLLVIMLIAKLVTSLEEPAPEIYLAPRNFNPHPYETGIPSGENNGPVLFPINPEDNIQSQNNIVTLSRKTASHPVDNHPYNKVARKHRYRLPGRYHNEETQPNPRVYQALANHAARVLTQPPQDLKNNHIPSISISDPRNYAFSYKVLDDRTGDDFSHSQSQDAKATNGEYRVKLPDGRVQIVSYTADKNGYKADVKYKENETPNKIHIQQAPIRKLTLQDYYQSNIKQTNKYVLFATPSPLYQQYNNYIDQPAYADNQPRQPNVQIFTTNARDYSVGSYIPPTSSPYYIKNVQNYQRGETSVIAPDVVHNGVHGLISPSPAPFVLADVLGNIIATVTSTVTPLIINNGQHGNIVPNGAPYQDFIITTASPPVKQDYGYIKNSQTNSRLGYKK